MYESILKRLWKCSRDISCKASTCKAKQEMNFEGWELSEIGSGSCAVPIRGKVSVEPVN
jgi:hypothetical protein